MASGGPISRRRRGLRVVAVACVVVVVAGRRRDASARASWRRLDEPAVAEVRAAAFPEADRPATVSNLHDDAPPSPALRRGVQGHDLVAQAERPAQGASMSIDLFPLPFPLLPAVPQRLRAAARRR